MGRIIPTGEQYFATLREKNLFYVDKTKFIVEWWSSCDAVTLITRPRRFGKTLLLDTVRTFFSPEFSGRRELFEGLTVWENSDFCAIQGGIPVIFVSFSNIKGRTYEEFVEMFKFEMARLYNYFIKQQNVLSDTGHEEERFLSIERTVDDVTALNALYTLSEYIYEHSHKKPIILLDEYDTPLQEAWLSGYWDEAVKFIRVFFNATFKTNPFLERALMTGITRVSKESIFSDMNNLEVVGITSNRYADCFGFTEHEVFESMDEYGLDNKKEVKKWYDGFVFGSQNEIYNPWSIIGYLKNKRIDSYWANTSSNALVGKLLARGSVKIKKQAERLLRGEAILTKLDEQVVFSQVYTSEDAIWGFLMAAGYVKPLTFDLENKVYEIAFTNKEVCVIFEKLISNWFYAGGKNEQFCHALLNDNRDDMADFLEDIIRDTFSYFDTGCRIPELFYHGFVLGLIVDFKDLYEIRSNRESGYGRYDIMLLPKRPGAHAIIIEFKTFNPKRENSLNETCINALRQIRDMHYIQELQSRNIDSDNIYVYGFAFKGKEVEICGGLEKELVL